MKQRQLGTSGLRISSIGLGTRTWDAGMDVDKARDVLRGFVSAGGTLVDAASLPLLAAALPAVPREELVLSLAAGVDPTAPVGMRVDCSRRSLLASLDRSLAVLGVDHVDIFSVEYWDGLTPPAEIVDTLESVVRSGRARYAGVRGYSGWQAAVTTSPQIVVAQAEYNLLDRSAEQELLPAAEFLGLGFIASSSLAHGILTGKYRDGAQPTDAAVFGRLDPHSSRVVEALGTAATGLGISPVTAALAWSQGRPGVSSTLVGVSDAAQLPDVLRAASVVLPAAIVEALDEVSAR
ncbi:aldo/keto reductase [Corynebacterium hindlerae]|uniref:Aldo/keto reductase n=1 Tax=Corynebacterium hindlerae TaxID=699041 RepID=A0A7G5FFC1_9CORY|nr:aldo/keto reductase [Corynebacterium hindlerae]QMV85312.1 aldo/keto reductase [Corynebacterium hindlerae]